MAEIAVVGAGVTGLSVALQLAERGRDAVVVERTGVAAGESGVQPGGVRQQWSTRVSCELARESLAFWRALPERLEAVVDPGLRACGYLFTAHSAPVLDGLRHNVALQRELGVPSRLVTPQEAAALVPDLDATT